MGGGGYIETLISNVVVYLTVLTGAVKVHIEPSFEARCGRNKIERSVYSDFPRPDTAGWDEEAQGVDRYRRHGLIVRGINTCYLRLTTK